MSGPQAAGSDADADGGVHTLAAGPAPPDAVEIGRARVYALIASLLLAAPDGALLQRLREAQAVADGDGAVGASEFTRAWQQLTGAACAMDAHAAGREHVQLFVASGAPEVDPVASLYLGGSRMDVPLAALRAQMRELGLARRRGIAETEDHLGVLCESMRLLIVGAPGLEPHPLERQRVFFETWIAPWYRACTRDIRSAKAANFYRCVAAFIDAFFELEEEAFVLQESGA